ncbi:hypothetical protein O3G_MSEX005882 [Manduca sexta]|uniref:Uncharacterized protein n=1 Tax=Manduca sexta TaxID=7130 RepID=A0A921Z1J5_MANSE|nr:hypothetical protein O3G_MSEX005882 [Manduca sexta]
MQLCEFSDLSAEQQAGFVNYKPSQKIEKNGDEYVLTIGPKVVKFSAGVEFEEKIGDNVSKSVIQVDGDVFNQVQNFGNGYVFNIKREFSDDALVLSISHSKWDGVGRRHYKP